MYPIFKELGMIGIVPVIKIDDPDQAVPLAQALITGGIPCAEITFRTAQAEASIRRMTKAFPDMLVCAGTVLSIEQVDRAVDAGAKLIVSPGLNPKIVQYCLDHKIPVCPGTSTPSDIEAAIELGLDTVKFFPAEASGGIKAIKAMSAPYTDMHFMPTGGINESNMRDYLSFDKVVCIGGSWMVPGSLINQQDYHSIARLCEQAMLSMLDLSLIPDAEKPVLATPYPERARKYLIHKGYRFSSESCVYHQNGHLLSVEITHPLDIILTLK